MKSTPHLPALLAAIVTLSGVLCAASAAEGAESDSHLVHVGNTTVEYFSVGKGETVVLLPGGSLSVNYLANLARSLDASGYRAVRINPRGAGASTGTAEGVTLHTLADDVAGVIKQLDAGPVWVAGHAFGNRVARMLASDHPELVKGVILLAAGGKVEPTPDAQKALASIFDSRTSEADYLDAMQYMVGDPADKALAGEALRQSRAPNAGPIQRTAGMSAKLSDWWAPAGQAPFLILQGANDQAAPPQNGQMLKADLGDRATLVNIPSAGHLVVLTKPDVVSEEIVNFIRQHANAGN
ncbi:MAG: alpha/beta hydrolase [Gammaproteobacteria bacterium]|nr:alpha/beta hydrolase [Gammaproteobacteria bacterium]MDH5241751.1 alpha/beta hydrolase [Gammaproteobacteria bacterium]MDH5308824.1 alpha/beta hydrolase [Gammaproteobacteria bacterium]